MVLLTFVAAVESKAGSFRLTLALMLLLTLAINGEEVDLVDSGVK